MHMQSTAASASDTTRTNGIRRSARQAVLQRYKDDSRFGDFFIAHNCQDATAAAVVRRGAAQPRCWV